MLLSTVVGVRPHLIAPDQRVVADFGGDGPGLAKLRFHPAEGAA
jgi:hypothetical protein